MKNMFVLAFILLVLTMNSYAVQEPDPVKNDATIAGIDSDNDGIRDDIQLWIDSEIKDPKIAKIVRKHASYVQLSLIHANDKIKSNEIARKRMDSLGCLMDAAGDDGYKYVKQIERKMHNTKDRLYAEMKSNQNFSGESYSMPSKAEKTKICENL